MRNPLKRRRDRLVRLHHTSMKESLEGIWVGMIDDHYHLRAARVIQDSDGRSTTLAGEIFVPRGKVTFLQTLTEDSREG